ncbi:MAG: aldehyde dehydrogenase family protein [Candidatus Sericytochromatia bacterium]
MSELQILNPATGEVIDSLPSDSAETIAAKYARARAAQKAWAKTSLDERLALMARFREQLVAQKDELAHLLTTEVGKPLRQSHNELNGFLGRFDFFQEKLKSTLDAQTVFDADGMLETISYEPLGVVANISAWNYPWLVGCNVFIPALLTGNAVLYKPSEFASLTGRAMARLFAEAGFPEDVFIPVYGMGEAGAALLQQPIDGVFFTGSYGTGRKINESVAGRLIRVGLELGGKDPLYVCDDVDVAVAAAGSADGAFYNNGQSCCAVERIYVHHSIYEPFVEAFADCVRDFVIGDPLAADTYIGALTRRGLQEQALEAQVADARTKGAKLLVGGERVDLPGWFFAPTVFRDVNHGMALMKEESFGPIIGIQSVADDDEAIALMNDTDYGLTSSVYTPDRERARRILAEMNSGTVYWNCCDRVSPRLPWSGRGHSGMGSTLSTLGILSFVQPKAWHWRG